jgi:hypothetical protein
MLKEQGGLRALSPPSERMHELKGLVERNGKPLCEAHRACR